jgi:hypothetical protein
MLGGSMKPTVLLTAALLTAGGVLTAAPAHAEMAAAAAPTWEPPTTLGSASRYGRTADVAVAPDGRAVAVWTKARSSHRRDTLMAAVRPAGGAWSDPLVLAAEAPGHKFPSVAMDARGTATVVWQDFDQDQRVSVRTRRITRDGRLGRTVVLGQADDGGGLPSLAVDPAGHVTVAWSKQDRAKAWIEVVRRKTGGSWTDPRRLSPRDGDAGLPKVASSAGGTVVVWAGAPTYYKAQRVWAARRVGGRWLPAERISARGAIFGADAVVTPDGEMVTTWSRYPVDGRSRVEVAERPAGGDWRPAVRLSTGDDGLDPVVGTGGDGNVVVAWRSFDADDHSRTAASVRPADGSWEPAVLLSPEGGDVWFPQVVVGSRAGCPPRRSPGTGSGRPRRRSAWPGTVSSRRCGPGWTGGTASG